MKHQLNLIPAERIIVLCALRNYKQNTKSFLRELINIAYNKLKSSTNPELDGMEMIIIVKALRCNANIFMLLGKEIERNIYLNLSNKIDAERQSFQDRNNPIIKRKAASVSTLTA